MRSVGRSTWRFGYVAARHRSPWSCFAAPLWYAWQVTIRDGRAEILQEDAQRLADGLRPQRARRASPRSSTRASDCRSRGERMLLFTDAADRRLAGNLRGWPRGVPAQAGHATPSPSICDGRPTMVAPGARPRCPAATTCWWGATSAEFAPLETRFWYGLAAAIAMLIDRRDRSAAILIRRALLSRIHSIRQTVSAIMQGELSHRLPTRGGNDELNTLSQTINRMLEQIEQLVHGISNVSNAIAHDLRTPLAELRSRLEELSLTRPPADETFAEVEAAVADVDRVIRIFNALLRLAEIDTGMRRSGFVPVDLAHVCAEVVEFYLPAAELKDIALSLHGTEAGDGAPAIRCCWRRRSTT